jgi:ornithine carbamoyltransferase
MKISLGGPESFSPGQAIRELLGAEGFPSDFLFTTNPTEAVTDADVVYTDVWVSMGCEGEVDARIETMKPYAVTVEDLAQAKPDALFMHCMPTHPGLEVAQEVLDSPQAIIFDQAENRLHMQKAILAKLAGASAS